MYYEPTLESLQHESVHVWYLNVKNFSPNSNLEHYINQLSSNEQEQRLKFYFEKDRHRFLLTRYLIRNILSWYFPEIKPTQWSFSKNAYGRPYVLSPRLIEGFNFNISHTQNIIVCSISIWDTVGIDIELVQTQSQHFEIAKHYFSQTETEFLRNLERKEQRNFFYRFWTLKEAFVKAEGKGLSIDLDKFWFTLSDKLIHFDCDITLNIEKQKYFFAQTSWSLEDSEERYEIALALKSKKSRIEPPEIHFIHFDNRRRYASRNISIDFFSTSTYT